MDSQNMNNGNNNENGSYNYQDNTGSYGSNNYQDNTSSYGSNNYQDNTGNYGNAYQQPSPYGEPVKQPTNVLAIISLILGIISIVICCCNWIACIFGIAGLICGIIAKKQSPSGLATAGIICSIVGLVFGGLILVLGLIGIAANPEAYMDSLQRFM